MCGWGVARVRAAGKGQQFYQDFILLDVAEGYAKIWLAPRNAAALKLPLQRTVSRPSADGGFECALRLSERELPAMPPPGPCRSAIRSRSTTAKSGPADTATPSPSTMMVHRLRSISASSSTTN